MLEAVGSPRGGSGPERRAAGCLRPSAATFPSIGPRRPRDESKLFRGPGHFITVAPRLGTLGRNRRQLTIMENMPSPSPTKMVNAQLDDCASLGGC